MLTIKMIRQDGSEFIEEAKSFAYNSKEQSASNFPSITYFTKQNDTSVVVAHDIYEGTIYVMNENGKTIGNYFLGEIKSEVE